MLHIMIFITKNWTWEGLILFFQSDFNQIYTSIVVVLSVKWNNKRNDIKPCYKIKEILKHYSKIYESYVKLTLLSVTM